MGHYFAQIKSGTHHRSKICRELTTMASSNQPFVNTNINSPPHRTRPTQGELVEEIMAAADTRHPLIDIAINLTDHSFDKDRDQILARAHRTGIEALIIEGHQVPRHQNVCTCGYVERCAAGLKLCEL